MDQPLVSIILTCYNKPNTVGSAIQSVIDQTYLHWELFIMDDASNEETKKEITRYLDDDRIYYFNSEIEDEDRHKTTRYATLINEAIPKSKGKYISYLTDDTVYMKNRLVKMVYFLEKNDGIDVVYSSQKIIEIDDQQNITNEKIRKTRGILSNASNIVDHCSVMHTRKIVDKVYRKYQNYWPDSPAYWHNGDAAFWARLNQFAKFYPLEDVLDISYKTPQSFQKLNVFLPSELPDGILVKGYSSDVYLLENSKRRKIVQPIHEKLYYDLQKVVTIPDPFLFKYEVGFSIDENIFRQSDLFPDNVIVSTENIDEVYLIQDGKKRKIVDWKTFEHYKYKKGQIVALEQQLLDEFEEGPELSAPKFEQLLPNNILFFDGEVYYLSQNNTLHEIDLFVMAKLKFASEQAVYINDDEKRKFPLGAPFEWNNYYGKKRRRKRKKRSY